MMKILGNPDWADLLEPLDGDTVKQIVLCMLRYPEQDCEHYIWKFMKKELARNKQKYDAKVDCLNTNRQKRWQSEQISEQISEQTPVPITNTSVEIDRKEKLDEINIKNIDKKKDIDLLLRKTARNFSPDAPKKYEINNNFSFNNLENDDPKFYAFSAGCNESKLRSAEKSLKNKHFGEFFTTNQIIGWIEQEGRY